MHRFEPGTLRARIGNDMKTFGLIFVLYEPTPEFLENLSRTRAICASIVVVDNSPEADLVLHERLRDEGMDVIFNRNQGGLAGAYNRGADSLLARNCDVLFLLDQDTEIDSLFFTEMMRAAAALGAEEFLIGPKIYEINLKKCMAVFPPDKRFPLPVRVDNNAEGMIPTLLVISSGSAISAVAYRLLGAFREDYFIECVDVEYSLRACSRKLPVFMNTAVTVRQTTGQIERHGNLFTTNHAAWRRYYGTRNAVHCLRLYRTRWNLHWLITPLVLYWTLNVLLFDSNKLRKVVAIVCGYCDGFLGRLGTFEARHPRIAAFCGRFARSPEKAGRGAGVTVTGVER
jgi:rhamnosyltransferase